ncbi:MAG: RNA methyltransferase [Sphingobacteriia bacterium]|jgi:tRNA (guanosine-2'-O-)-methyltransferase
MTPERKDKIETVLLNRQPHLALVMENVHDHHNISAVMRTCDAVGIQDIYVLNTKIPRHEYFGVKSSSSAAKWLTVHHFDDTEKCFKNLRHRYEHIYATHLGENAKSVYEIDFSKSIALVFGNEHEGVTKEAVALSDGCFIIPQVGMIQSLNISVACAVTIYEAYRQKKIAGHYDQTLPLHPEYKLLAEQWAKKKTK